MFNGNRSDGPKGLGGFGIAAALLLCCLIVGVVAYLQGKQTERRDQTPADYASAAKDDAQRSCVRLEAGAAFECIYEKVEAAKEQANTEQDLTAQQRAADSALVSALVSAFTLLVSIAGVWYVKRTLDATLKAVEDTSEATEAMREANKIAIGNSRPWIAVDMEISQSAIFRKGKFSIPVWLNIRNVGVNPATKLVIKFKSFNAVTKMGYKGREFIDECVEQRDRTIEGGLVLVPNEKIKRRFFITLEEEDFVGEGEDEGKVFPIAVVSIHYDWPGNSDTEGHIAKAFAVREKRGQTWSFFHVSRSLVIPDEIEIFDAYGFGRVQ